MKQIVYIIASVLAIASVACSKQETTTDFVENHDPAHRTFMVDVQQTKTTLDGLAVKWASTDEIRILGYTEGEEVGNAVFKLKSGAGSTSAVFEIKEGETLAEYDEYYAVYPAVAIRTSELANGKIALDSSLSAEPAAVENGFDPSLALMTAKYTGDKLVFRHAMAYIKLQIAQDGITKVIMAWTGGTASCKRPEYDKGDGSFEKANSGYTSFTSTGTFNNGSYYYFPIVARGGAPGTITLTYYKGEAEASTSTTSLSSKPWVQGEVYDLGAPVVDFSPNISADDVKIEADVTAGSIDFTVSSLVDGGVVTKSVVSSTIVNLSLGAVSFNTSTGVGSVSFTCDENDDDENDRTAVVQLTYTYGSPEETVTKNVTITQNKAGVVVLVPVTTTTSWATTFAGLSEQITTGSEIHDNLNFISGGKTIKFGTSNSTKHCQLSGTGTAGTECCLQFMAGGNGTLTIEVAAGSDNSDRAVVVYNGSTKVGEADVFTKTKVSPAPSFEVTANSGDLINIISKKSGINIYNITWTPAS